jgi:hypothetical protein
METTHCCLPFSTRSALRLCALGLGIALSVSALRPLPACADGQADGQAEGRDQTKNYTVLIKRALEEFQHQRWVEARALFERAHAIKPSARTLRGMGVSAHMQRQYVVALGYLEQAGVDTRQPLTQAMRAEVERLITEGRTFIARYRVRTNVEGVSFTVDGEPRTLDDNGVLSVDPGEHEVIAQAEGHKMLARRVNAEPGRERSLELELEPIVSHEAASLAVAPVFASEPVAARVPTDSEPAHHEIERSGRVWTWVALGGAVVFAGGAATTWAVGAGKVSDVERACAKTSCTTAELRGELDRRDVGTFETLTTVGLGLSLASLATAGALWFVEGEAETSAKTVALHVGAGSVTLQGAF